MQLPERNQKLIQLFASQDLALPSNNNVVDIYTSAKKLFDDMLKEADAGVFGMKMYPHIDKYETAYLAMKTLIGKLRGEIDPVTAYCPVPILIPCSGANTLKYPTKR